MKKLFTLSMVISMTFSVFAQSPQKMTYQCVVRNASGVLVTSQSIGIRISILQGTSSGTVVFSETYSPNPQTNANGLLTLEIGSGSVITGTFSAINWSAGPYFLKTETDPSGGTNYTIVGTSQLLSVPYALHSKTAQTADYNNLTNLPNLSGYLTAESDPMFVASPASGITKKSIDMWNTAFDWGDHAGLYRPIGYVPAWSEITGKPATTSGYGITDAVTIATNQTITGIKTFSNDLLINTLTIGRGKGDINTNTAIGAGALYTNTTGSYNTVNGYNALYYNTTGNSNTAYGYGALYTNTTGSYNTANGYDALLFNTTGYQNTANGFSALYSNTTGYSNTANGWSALLSNTTGYNNTANGDHALFNNTTGNENTATGQNALLFNTTGNSNTANGNNALYSNTTGYSNTANGFDALYSNTTGYSNTANGFDALYYNTTGYTNTASGWSALLSNTTGAANTANGYGALFLNTTGTANTADGNVALYSNTTGGSNTAIGSGALYSNTTGNLNTATGYAALYFNTTGSYNTANGYNALFANTTGFQNTANGYEALFRNTTGSNNTANGYKALTSNTTGYQNTASGNSALAYNTTGYYNTASGNSALQSNSTGSINTAIGFEALVFNTTGTMNTAIGVDALYSNFTGNNNTAIGAGAGTATDNLTNTSAIGYHASVYASNNFVFGDNQVIGWGFGVSPGSAAIRVGSSASNGNGATLTVNGAWTNASDISKKYDIENINYGLDEVMKLRPVTYKLKGSDNQDIGFIAQEVKRIIPEIVYGEEGEMTLSYGQITSVLVKAIQDQQKQIDELKALVKSLISIQSGQANK